MVKMDEWIIDKVVRKEQEEKKGRKEAYDLSPIDCACTFVIIGLHYHDNLYATPGSFKESY